MATEPAVSAEWATDGSAEIAPYPTPLLGWVSGTAIATAFVNYWFNVIWLWIAYFKSDISSGRAADGYKYSPAWSARWMVSPAMGGWIDTTANTAEINHGATPPHVHPSAAGGGTRCVVRIPLRAWLTQSGVAIDPSPITIDLLNAEINGLAASSEIIFSIVSFTPASASPLATEWTQTYTSSLNGTWQLVTPAIALTPTVTKEYALEISTFDTLVKTNVAVGGVALRVSKTRVE